MATETALETTKKAGAPPSLTPAPGYFAPLSEVQNRLSAEDRAAVADLVLRFEWCYDTRDYQALEDMLTEDAVMDHVWGYREGRSAVLTMLREWEYANAGLRHQGINLVVWGEPDGTAGAMSFLYGVTMRGPITGGSAGEGPVFERPAGHGLVTDRFRRGSDGIWRMTRRTIDQMYLDAEFVPDAAVREWFALSAEQRQAYPDKPAGWLPDAA